MPFIFINSVTKNFRNRYFFVSDIFIVLMSPLIALLIRHEGKVDLVNYLSDFFYVIIVGAGIKLIIYYYFGLYSQFWNAASVDELAKLIFAGIVSTIIEMAVFNFSFIINNPILTQFPLSFPLLDGFTAIFLVSLSRFSSRLTERANQKFKSKSNTNTKKIVGIVGAGQGGIMICRELFRFSDKGRVVVFIDDDPLKHNLNILGIPVEGPINKLPEIIRRYHLDKVIVSMPSASGVFVRKVSDDCINADIEVLIAPALNEILDGKITFQQLRKVQIEDLLRREPIETDIQTVQNYLRNKRVMITGAGGSIGSELCRQIINFTPAELILVGHGENSIFEIEQELIYRSSVSKRLFNTKIISKIIDIRSKDYLSSVFNETKPEILFHAAAHKHVPMMENNPGEAIRNNILGTRNLVELAIEYNINSFIMISTDKAVNPTSIMGATKRVSELITLSAANNHNKSFSAVRFGNVLGSRGSVLHTFRKQVQNGGPVLITDPEITRYFMTIPEAVQLVLQASVLSKGGEIFVLDMGEHIKIVDLARDYIRLSGLKEGIDINIEFIGLRPGEKLFEELFVKGEDYIRTVHQKILIASNASKLAENNIENKIDELITETKFNDLDKVYHLLKSILPEYNPAVLNNFIKIGNGNSKN